MRRNIIETYRDTVYAKGEYRLCIQALEEAGMMVPLKGGPGVVGIDGDEYPAPTEAQTLTLFERDADLIEEKRAQGFTRLLLTPIAMPLPRLIDHVNAYVNKRSEQGPIIRTKRDHGDPDVAVEPSSKEPVWIWERVGRALDTPEVVYFPTAYEKQDHGGQSKDEVVHDPRRCVVPGWSVGLVEDIPIMPRKGGGEVVGGRRQLEAGSTPRDYLETLLSPPYRRETGWTMEDMLTHFLTVLHATGQVSHDRSDGNALWLLGMYMPTLMPKALVVPTGHWSSGRGRRLYLGAHRTGNRFDIAVARTVVRLQG